MGADTAPIAPLLQHLRLGYGHRARSGDFRLEKKVAVRLLDVAIEQGDRLPQRSDGQGKIDSDRRLPRPSLSAGNGDLQYILLLIFISFTMFYKLAESAARLCCRRLHFLETRSNNENSTPRTVMPFPLPRSVDRPSQPDPESAILCGNPAPRSFDAPAPLTEQPPKPRPIPAPIPLGPVPSPLGIRSPPYLIPHKQEHSEPACG